LEKTSGLLLSDFDPFDSLGTEHRFMAELSLIGEFRFVEGPIYFKNVHGENLSLKRMGWSRAHWITALACFAAWMIEVIAPAGTSVQERRRLFKITLERFAGSQDPLKWKWIWSVLREKSKGLLPLRMIPNQLLMGKKFRAFVQGLTIEERAALLRQVFERLKSGGRFDPRERLNTTWEALESKTLRDYRLESF
jgi:hypothetical protein